MALAGACAAAGSAAALETSSHAELWLQAQARALAQDAPFNAGNRFLRLPRSSLASELRLEVRGEHRAFGFKLRARGVFGREDCGCTPSLHHDLYASQASLRWQVDDATLLTAGRQLLTWGPGMFRSPSNPFYFDAGRTQPLRELSGLDALQLSSVRDGWSWHAAQVLGSGHTGGREGEDFSGSQTGRADLAGTSLLRLATRLDALELGGVAARQDGGSTFAGGYATWNIDDAWMAWAEVGNGRRPGALATSAAGYVVQAPSPRATTLLAGGSYTLESGHSLQGEYLYDGHGWDRSRSRAYFATARRAGALLGGPLAGVGAGVLQQGLQNAPASLSRHYLAAAWQSSPGDTARFWRAGWAMNLADRSHQATLYVDQSLDRRTSWFASVVLNGGASAGEFGALVRRSVAVGIKVLLF